MTDDDLPPMPANEDARLAGRPSRARYDRAHHHLERRWRRRLDHRHDRMMKEIIDALWGQFAQSPYSWCGFYLCSPGHDALILGPHRDQLACSLLPLGSACGKAAQSGQTQIVAGAGRSEIAVPVFDDKGQVWGVLDVTSAEQSAFDSMDQRWLERLLKVFAQMPRP